MYVRTVTSYLFADSVYGPFGQSNKHSTPDLCPRPARKETNVPLHKRNFKLTVLIYGYTVLSPKKVSDDRVI